MRRWWLRLFKRFRGVVMKVCKLLLLFQGMTAEYLKMKFKEI